MSVFAVLHLTLDVPLSLHLHLLTTLLHQHFPLYTLTEEQQCHEKLEDRKALLEHFRW